MKNFISFVVFLTSLFISLSGFQALASTDVFPEDVSYDYVYFNEQRGPYHIKDDVLLRPGQTIKIDKGAVFFFNEGADLCFQDRECLKGEWLYKDGLGGSMIEVRSDILISIEEGSSRVRYLFDQVDHRYDVEKELNIGIKSLYDPVIDLKIRDSDSDHHNMMIYLSNVIFDPDVKFDGEAPYEAQYDNGYDNEDVNNSNDPESNIPSRSVAGRIFLQVEENGEAWYVNPENGQRYYLGRPADAFTIMRDLALGVKHSFIEDNDLFPERVAGRIILDVEDKGKAYYINPSDKKAYYLGRPTDAFTIMREQGIGIKNDDLERIPQAF